MPKERKTRGVSWRNLFSPFFSGKTHEPTSTPTQNDEDNPWFQRSEDSYEIDREASPYRTMQTPPGIGQSVRWLSDSSSPYGFSDEDGTLKQVDSQNWRSAFGKSSQRGFVSGTRASSRWQKGRGRTQKSPMLSSSTWLLQTLAAVVLVAAGVYVTKNPAPVAQRVHSIYESAFSKDYSPDVVPAVETFLQDHHVNLPVELNPSSAINFHIPVSGQIAHDYSTSHPEMTIVGTPNEAVMAAGSGTVTRITSTDAGDIVMINHGKVGESLYTGVYNVSVKTGQYVSSGQVIGHLASSGSPELQFGFERNGTFVNPHDYIHFPTSSS